MEGPIVQDKIIVSKKTTEMAHHDIETKQSCRNKFRKCCVDCYKVHCNSYEAICCKAFTLLNKIKEGARYSNKVRLQLTTVFQIYKRYIAPATHLIAVFG